MSELSEENRTEEIDRKEIKRGFIDLLKVIGFVSLVIGMIAGGIMIGETDFRNVTAWIFIFGGICSYAFWKGMSIIIEAARIYIEKNNE